MLKKSNAILLVLLLSLASCFSDDSIENIDNDLTETTLNQKTNGNSKVGDTYANIRFQSTINNRYLSSENGQGPMRLNRTQAAAWEKFTVVDLGNRRIAIRGNNGKYVSSENGAQALTCYRATVGDWETFQLEFLGNDQYAIRGNNGRYLTHDHAGEQYLWSTSTGVGDTERFYIRGLPTLSFGTNSLQLIKDDMRLLNQGFPHGVPRDYNDTQGFGWFKGPRLSYGNNPPLDWFNMRTWGQVYEDSEGSPAQNVRTQIRNMQAWYLSKSTGQWALWEFSSEIEGANYVEDFSGNGSVEADVRDESSNGGGISATLIPGHNFHFWIRDYRPEMDPSDVAGVWVSIEARLIEDNPNQPYDLNQARLLFAAGADYWKSATIGFTGWENPSNGDIGIGRHRFLSPKWQSFNMHTLSDEQLMNNPPPFNR